MAKRLGILSSHPIQYYAPLFRYLAQKTDIDLTVLYCQKPTPDKQGTGFGLEFDWDIDLTSGYQHVWLKNVARRPDLTHFNGCDTPELRAIIKAKKFDAFMVLGWNNKSFWQAMHACWKTQTPLLVRSDSHMHYKSPWMKRAIKKFIYPYFMRRFSVCLAVGKWSAEYFKHYGAQRILFSPHCVDSRWFHIESEKLRKRTPELKAKWGLSHDSIILLFAGKFEEKKRPMDLLKALYTLREDVGGREIKLELLMVGSGAHWKSCKQYSDQHRLPVRFLGFINQSEMPSIYAVAHALVLPSDGRETWGLVVNEAMACGLPAILSDQVGCYPDLILTGQTGYTFPCGDTIALARIIERFIRDPKLAERMGKSAKIKISDYSVEHAADGILSAIAQVNS